MLISAVVLHGYGHAESYTVRSQLTPLRTTAAYASIHDLDTN